MSPEPKVPAQPRRPKPRIPLPTQPAKVIDDDKVYKRKPKHPKRIQP
ncbi:hypothetical protein HZB60_02520 [candidate division KSB1 bacterium]|nr:hypothetical protein [candidate division KSB1 bacterium]